MLEGVNERVSFQQGSASKLPFQDQQFDCVVSNLTFHEVQDQKDKLLLIHEAVRVLKPGGKFSFLDMFFNDLLYGSPEELKRYLDLLEINEDEARELSYILQQKQQDNLKLS